MNIIRRANELIAILDMSMRQRKMGEGTREQVKVYWEFQSLFSKVKIWAERGMKTFMLSKELIEAFNHTDVPLDIYPTDFNYPFNCFTIEGDIPLFNAKGIDDKSIPVYAILYCHRSIVDPEKNLLIAPNGKAYDTIEWDISLTGLSPGIDGIGLDQMWINMKNTETLEAAYKNSKVDNKIRTVLERSEAQDIANIFFNTIMYINDPTRVEAETTFSYTHKIRIGPAKKDKVKRAYILLKPPKSYKSLSASTGRHIDKRFVVRGHYRQQAYGEKMSLRKRIWIMPHWKGPDMSEVVSKPYKVR